MPYWKNTAFVFALTACSGKQADTSAPKAAATGASRAAAVRAVTSDSAALPVRPIVRQSLRLTQLPAALRPAGQLLEAWRWSDANGENLLVVSRTITAPAHATSSYINPAPTSSEPDTLVAEDVSRTARLLVRQYVRHGSRYQPLWQLQDAVAECPLDLTLGLLPGSTSITDLDADGLTETTLLYALGCRGGVDPAALKLIMHEGVTKFALRGSAIQMVGGPEEVARAKRLAAGPVCCAGKQLAEVTDYQRTEGLYNSEQSFARASPLFLAFARQQWRWARTRADTAMESL